LLPYLARDDAMTDLAARTKELALLIAALTQTYHRMTSSADLLHDRQAIGAAARSVLLLMAKGQPLTFTEIAAARSVSRQFVQRLATEMIVDGLLIADANPRHKRSPKLRLSEKGNRAVQAIYLRESIIMAQLGAGLSEAEMRSARITLQSLGEDMEALHESLIDRPVKIQAQPSRT